MKKNTFITYDFRCQNQSFSEKARDTRALILRHLLLTTTVGTTAKRGKTSRKGPVYLGIRGPMQRQGDRTLACGLTGMADTDYEGSKCDLKVLNGSDDSG